MSYLILSVITSVLVVCFFKMFEQFKVNTFVAIVTNYATCTIMGNIAGNKAIILTPFYNEPWFYSTLFLGLLFISVFYCIALTAQKNGVSVSMVAAKLSVAIPVITAFLWYNDSITLLKILGIASSFVGVYLIASSPNQSSTKNKNWYLPLAVFVGSGIIDTLLNMVNHKFIPPADTNAILSVVFFTAFCLGLIWLIIKLITKKATIKYTDVIWGIALGIPNYLCMYFLLKTLHVFNQATIALPLNNILILMLTALVGWLGFKEALSPKKLIGLGFAFISIVILAFAV